MNNRDRPGSERRTRAELIGRVRSLALGEAVNIVVQPIVFFLVLDVPLTVPNVVGFGLVIVLLLQGTAYWVTKYFQLTRQQPRLAGVGLFFWLRRINAVLLLGGLIVILPAVSLTSNLASWPALGFWAFAVLEYINYFHTQIMPTPGWGGWRPRRSRLAGDLNRLHISASS